MAEVRFLAGVGAVLATLAGCQATAVADDVPAHIVAPTDASRAALQHAVNDALNTNVLLADDALTVDSTLVIERNIPGSIDGQSAQGRIMEAPFRFRLVKNGDACILIDERDATRYELADTDCAP